MSKINTATSVAKAAAPSLPVWPLLTATLIVLKLIGLITISWWWVFAPLWIPLSVAVAILLVIAFIALVLFIISEIVDAKK